jgi:hypothetical protein
MENCVFQVIRFGNFVSYHSYMEYLNKGSRDEIPCGELGQSPKVLRFYNKDEVKK